MSDKNVNTQGHTGMNQVRVPCNAQHFVTVTINEPGQPTLNSGNVCADLARTIGEVIYDLASMAADDPQRYAAEAEAEQNGKAYVTGRNPKGKNYAPAGSDLDNIINAQNIDISFHTNRIDTNVPSTAPGKTVSPGAKIWHIAVPDGVASTADLPSNTMLTKDQYKLLLGTVAICGCKFA